MKKRVNNSQRDKRNINWFSATAFTASGKDPCESMVESINLYNSFNLDQESKRVASYGVVEMRIDFSKLSLLLSKEDGYPFYPFGIIFFSDLDNKYDNYLATVSCIPDRIEHVLRYKYIKPVSFTDTNLFFSCRGKFRYRGNFIIFYVSKEIEREEGVFYPDVNIISVSVGTIRDTANRLVINETGVTDIKKGSTCVSDFSLHLVKDIFSFYGVKDNQFSSELIHAFGLDPVELGLPPSLSDDRSRYYGNRVVHMASKGHYARHEKQFGAKTNIFSYLNEINNKNEENVILSPPENAPKEREYPKATGNQKNSKKNKAGKKGNGGDPQSMIKG
jgi:hypothetical protein